MPIGIRVLREERPARSVGLCEGEAERGRVRGMLRAKTEHAKHSGLVVVARLERSEIRGSSARPLPGFALLNSGYAPLHPACRCAHADYELARRTIAPRLDRRTRHRPISAEHAAVARLGLEPLAAARAVIEEPAGVGGHL